MLCAHCGTRMHRSGRPGSWFWMCPSCSSRLATLALLRRTLLPGPLDALWRGAQEGRGRAGRDCPSCRAGMRELPLLVESEVGGKAVVDLDVCTRCHLVFFDVGEFEQMELAPVQLAPRGPARVVSRRPPEARPPSVDPMLQAKLDRIDREARDRMGSYVPPWKMFVALFAPVEVEAPTLRRFPLGTWAVAALLVVVAVVTFGDLGAWIGSWGYLPAQPLRHGGLTAVSSFLLHAGVMHLLGNLWFLIMFGDNVEDFLGLRRFLALLALATLGGLALHTAADPRSVVPLVGASGGISGLVVFYSLRFPQAKVGMIVFFQWLLLPAWLYALFWLGLQSVGALGAAGGGVGGVAYLAHLGGAAVGLIAWFTWGREA